MRCLHFAVLFICMPVFTVLGQTSESADQPAQDPVTLEDYLRTAAENNAGLRAAFEQWQMAVLAVEPAASLDDPRFTYAYFIEEVETRVGPQKHRLSLSQTFPWFGTLEARKDAAAAIAQAAQMQYEAKKLDLFEQTKNIFYEYSYLTRSVQIAKENLELLKHFEQVAQARYRTATGKHPDIIRAQIEMATLEDQVQSLEDMRRPLSAKINAVLNRDKGNLLSWPVWTDRKPPILALDMLNRDNSMNPELEAMDYETQAARQRAELAKKRYYPNVTVGVDWIMTDEARMPNVYGSGRDPVIAMFSLNIPLWTDSYRAQEHRSWADVRKTERQKVQKEYDLDAQIAQVVFDLKDSLRKINLHRDVLIPKAKEMIQTSEEAYRAGTVDFLSLLDAQRKLLLYELALERSVTNHFQQQARLEKLLGGELPIVANVSQ